MLPLPTPCHSSCARRNAGEEWGAIYDDGAKGLAGAKDVRQVPVKPLQAHWHSTSEHLVDGEPASAMHCLRSAWSIG